MNLKRNHFCNSVTSGTKSDYPELTGVEVLCSNDLVGIVQGVNFDIGISIAEKSNPNNYITCMPGPSSPEWEMSENSMEDHDWNKIFYATVDEIKQGRYFSEWQKTIANYNVWGGMQSPCSWSI